jgi:hypothetical protein
MHQPVLTPIVAATTAEDRHREGATERQSRTAPPRPAWRDRLRATRLRATAVACALIAAPLALAANAAATQPTVEFQTLQRQFVDSCGDFNMISDFYPERRITTFYDQDGNPIKRVLHAKVPGTITNSLTGKSLPVFGERVITTDLITGAVSSTGTSAHVVVPGMGTVLLGAGHSGIDENGEPFAEGRLDQVPTAALCEALAAL